MKFQQILKKRRKELGYTLKEIADKIGVTEATVQRWESGNIKTLRHGRLSKLAEILELPPPVLMGWIPQENTLSLLEDKTPLVKNNEGSLDDELIRRLCLLTPEEQRRVDDFVQGILASR